jgi:hypothetical protein
LLLAGTEWVKTVHAQIRCTSGSSLLVMMFL